MSKWPDGEILELLLQHGFKLVRQTKHQVWKNPAGKVYILSGSPSDVFAYKNALSELKRVIGIGSVGKDQSQPGERREHKIKQKPAPVKLSISTTAIANRPTMADQLRNLGFSTKQEYTAPMPETPETPAPVKPEVVEASPEFISAVVSRVWQFCKVETRVNAFASNEIKQYLNTADAEAYLTEMLTKLGVSCPPSKINN